MFNGPSVPHFGQCTIPELSSGSPTSSRVREWPQWIQTWRWIRSASFSPKASSLMTLNSCIVNKGLLIENDSLQAGKTRLSQFFNRDVRNGGNQVVRCNPQRSSMARGPNRPGVVITKAVAKRIYAFQKSCPGSVQPPCWAHSEASKSKLRSNDLYSR